MTSAIGFQFLLVLLLTACFKKTEAPSQAVNDESLMPKISTTGSVLPGVSKASVKEKLLIKPQRESIYFAASLEKEALKLLLKNPSFDELTLFSVLSYAVEANAGIKKMAPSRLDCSRFVLELNPDNIREIKVFKTCQKPSVLLAIIDRGLSVQDQSSRQDIKVTFFIKEWAQVVGLSVLLAAKDPVCSITIEDKKLQRFKCENWSRSVTILNTSAEEIRLTTFKFERTQKNQFVLKGGRYKDLIERAQFNIEVPLEGKIVRWEKEIEVIDEFADRLEPVQAELAQQLPQKPVPTPAKPLQINGEKNDSEEIPSQQTSQENPGQTNEEKNQVNNQAEIQLGIKAEKQADQSGQDDGTNGGIPPSTGPQQPGVGR